MNERPKITVYAPCHNYGRFLRECVESVLRQSEDRWELIIIDDGSTDDSQSIADDYASKHPEKIKAIHFDKARGLRACANHALDLARGDYIMRLDADDYLDENALLALSHYLDEHPDVGLVYPNYTYVAENGDFLGVEYRKKVGDEDAVLDLPAHGACTMVRKRVIKSVGGYDENADAQDGHELWLKILHRFQVGNVSTPLFFYRQHGTSLSRDDGRLLAARRKIKRVLAEKSEGNVRPRVVAVVPAKNTYEKMENIALRELGGHALIDYTLASALEAEVFDTVFVTTDDQAVADHCEKIDGISAMKRPPEYSQYRKKLSEVLYHAVTHLERERDIHPDIIVLLSIHSPLRRAEHIRESIDTLQLYNLDSVASVYEDYDLHFRHDKFGLKPLNAGALHQVRLEREALFVDNGAIHTLWRDIATDEDYFGRKIGHIVMPKRQSFQIKSEEDVLLLTHLLEQESEHRNIAEVLHAAGS